MVSNEVLSNLLLTRKLHFSHHSSDWLPRVWLSLYSSPKEETKRPTVADQCFGIVRYMNKKKISDLKSEKNYLDLAHHSASEKNEYWIAHCSVKAKCPNWLETQSRLIIK